MEYRDQVLFLFLLSLLFQCQNTGDIRAWQYGMTYMMQPRKGKELKKRKKT